MGLLEDLSDESNFPKTRRAWCSVCELVKGLPSKDAEAFKARLANKAITHAALAVVLKKNGHDISSTTIGRHRRGICTGDAK